MEAIAKHDFNATTDDELSFKKGTIVKVCSSERITGLTVLMFDCSLVFPTPELFL